MLFNSIFGRNNSTSSLTSSSKDVKLNQKNHQSRHVAFESLESRDLLTVTMGEIDDATYDEIREAYPEFELPELQADLNVMTITPNDGALSLSDLQTAIYAAGESSLPDLILVHTSDDANSMVFSSSFDELAIDIDSGSVTIIGWGSENLTLDANQQSRVMIISESSTVNLAGLTVTGGDSSASLIFSDIYGAYAGGIGSLGTLTISACTITGNTASEYGGGIASSGTLTIINSLISDNTTTGTDDYSGGGGIASSGTVTIFNSEISGNEAASGAGIISSEGTLSISQCVISQNISTSEYSSGGGIVNSQGTLTISNSVISDNSAVNGGGIYNWGLVSITQCEIINNTADGIGGGICNDYGMCTVISSTVSGNNSQFSGGGMYCWEDCTLTVMNSSITENVSYQGGGGGIYSKGVSDVINSTISGNSAESGGGICNSNEFTVTNSTIAGNRLTESPDVVGAGIYNSGAAAINNSIIVDAIYNENETGTITGSNNVSVYTGWSADSYNIAYDSTQPLFVDAENGDYHLAAGSQAIDKGDNEFAVDVDGIPLAYDMDGAPRISNGTVDIGAYEYQVEPISYSTVVNTLNDSFDLNDNEWSLREAIYYAPEYVTITFADNLKGVIVLDQNLGELVIGQALAIDGGGRISIDANHNSRVIMVAAGTSEAPVVLNGLTIQNGYLDNEDGGTGVYNAGVLTVSNCKIESNTASGDYGFGGGIFNGYECTLTVENSKISGNEASFSGGGICNEGFLTVTDCTIAGNSAGCYGAGIEHAAGTAVITNCVIMENTVSGNTYVVPESFGGGIYSGAELTISNSLIVDNAVYGEYGIGAGINSAYDTVITNCTIAGNSAAYGSGIYNENILTVNNSIILDAIINEYIDIDGYQRIGVLSGSNNLSSYTDWASGSNNIDYVSTKALFVNAENGNYRLAEDSQAIDMGNNQWAFDAGLDETSTDLAHRRRFVGDAIDIGAYEFNENLDYLGVVTTQINIYDDTNDIPDSVSQLTDWDRFYLELWTSDVSEFAPGNTFEAVVTYNPKFHQLDTTQTVVTPNGITAEIIDQTVEEDGSVTVYITLTVSDSGYTAPGNNTCWGSILFTPSTAEGAGADDQFSQESLGVSVNGYETETKLIAMPFDFDNDNAVDVDDFVAFASVYGYKPSSFDIEDPRYAQTRQADFDSSGVVDVNDFVAFATNYGLKKGQNYKIVLPQIVNAVPGASAPVAVNEHSIEEQAVVVLPASTLQVETVETVLTLESTTDCLTPAQPTLAESVQTLLQTHSSALLDLYDNQNGSNVSVELSAAAIDEALNQDGEFDFLFDESDLDSDDDSNVDFSFVLDELEFELI